jgi:hypothetical protein
MGINSAESCIRLYFFAELQYHFHLKKPYCWLLLKEEAEKFHFKSDYDPEITVTHTTGKPSTEKQRAGYHQVECGSLPHVALRTV